MPVLKLKHVVCFSSEDEKHPAENILKPETYYKYKNASGNEANATIVLQLEKTSKISGIDIGNNGSAFIEVLVGRSTWSPTEEFKVLLAASSFMTPSDSKAGKDLIRVRMFGLENLNKQVASEKWDQIKVVCTQPYNTTESYGLSFMKVYCPIDEESSRKQADEKSTISLGRFKMKSESDNEGSSLTAGSFFQRRLNIPVNLPTTPQMSMAASARSSEPSPKTSTIFKARNQDPSSPKKMSISDDRRQEVANALMQGSDTKPEKGSVKLKIKSTTPEIQKIKKNFEVLKRKSEQQEELGHPSKKLKEKPRDDANNNASEKIENNLLKRPKVKKKNVPYSDILKGVVFVLSGYQNPERSNIRDLALSMGAKYEANWNTRCTHLVCAFANTPKFKEVQGKGKIVRKKWIDECDEKKRRLNTKTYRIDGKGDSSFESSGSEEEMIKTPAQSEKDVRKSSSEYDTEDELEKIRELEKGKGKENEIAASEDQTSKKEHGNSLDSKDVYNCSTDEEQKENESEGNATPIEQDARSLPKLFENKKFFFLGEYDPKDERLLKRHIKSYSGTVSDKMSDIVDIVVSNNQWDTEFQKVSEDNPHTAFLQPTWIFKCHEKQTCIPYVNYAIKPS